MEIKKILFDSINPNLWNSIKNQNLFTSIFQSYEYNKIWFDIFKPNEHIIKLTEQDEIIAIFPLYQTNNTLLFFGGKDITDYHAPLIKSGYEKNVFEEIKNYIRKNKFKLELNHLHNIYSTLLELNEQEIAISNIKLNFEKIDDYTNYLKSNNINFAGRLISQIEKINRSYSNLFEFEITTNNLSNELITLMKESFTKKKFFEEDKRREEFFKQISPLAKFGSLKLNPGGDKSKSQYLAIILIFEDELKINSEIIKQRLAYNTGYIENDLLKKAGPGMLLFYYLIKDSIVNNFFNFNFLRGSENYKFNLGAKKENLYSFNI